MPTSLIFQQARDEYRSCQLCPKKCGFNRLEKSHPTCGDSSLRVATFGISHGDEPAIRGTQGSGAIMLSGCPLKCPSCHNPEKVSHGTPTSPEAFLRICKDLYDRGAHNIQILSPTVHLPALRAVLIALRESRFPLSIVLKSSGYESVEQLQRLEGLVDVYLPDFKFGPHSSWSRRAGVRDYFEKASTAVHEMFRQVGGLTLDASGVAKKGVLIRHVRAPLPADEQALIDRFLGTLPAEIGLSIQNNFVTLE
ncbi:radical SAM protein [bacterium]|nr:radical SAM protein [bacterium]